MKQRHGSNTNQSMIVLLSETDVSETYVTNEHEDGAFLFGLAPEDVDLFIDTIESLIPEEVDLDTSNGMTLIQVFASSLDEVPENLSEAVDTLDEVTTTQGSNYLLVTLPPAEASEVITKSKEVLFEWQEELETE